MTNSRDEIKITHVIFDLDGVLVNTEPINAEAFKLICAKYGKDYTREVRAASMGMTHDDTISYIVNNVGLSGIVSLKKFALDFDNHIEKLLPDCELMPGALRLVKHLASSGIPLALCTSSSTSEFELKMLKHQELAQLFPIKVMAGDDPAVKLGKPAPDPFLVTMGRFETKPASPSNVLVFEDSLNGVRAAVAAGMNVVMMPNFNFVSPSKDVIDRITLVLSSLDDFKPETLGLPPYQ